MATGTTRNYYGGPDVQHRSCDFVDDDDHALARRGRRPQDRQDRSSHLIRRITLRHPRTQFICLHVADSEDLAYVSECLDSHPNMHVEIAARIGELGRQARAASQFIDKYQDRIMFGTDAIPGGRDTPQQVFNDQLYVIYYRFLETRDGYFDYAPAAVPPQGSSTLRMLRACWGVLCNIQVASLQKREYAL
ncbi:MAG TPA: hypothetical protein VGE93_10075 [Bryobacteraceae bacterium]